LIGEEWIPAFAGLTTWCWRATTLPPGVNLH
jgi:hypothetical protein